MADENNFGVLEGLEIAPLSDDVLASIVGKDGASGGSGGCSQCDCSACGEDEQYPEPGSLDPEP